MTKKIAHTEVDSKNEKTNPFCRASNLPSGQSRTLKNKKTTKRTHFPVRHLPMVSYREFSGFWYTKLLPFLLDFSHHKWWGTHRLAVGMGELSLAAASTKVSHSGGMQAGGPQLCCGKP